MSNEYAAELNKQDTQNQIQELDWTTINLQDLKTVLFYEDKYMCLSEAEEKALRLDDAQFSMLMRAHSLATDVLVGRKKWMVDPVTKEKQSHIERQTIEQLYPKDQMFLKQYLEGIVAWLERKFE